METLKRIDVTPTDYSGRGLVVMILAFHAEYPGSNASTPLWLTECPGDRTTPNFLKTSLIVSLYIVFIKKFYHPVSMVCLSLFPRRLFSLLWIRLKGTICRWKAIVILGER